MVFQLPIMGVCGIRQAGDSQHHLRRKLLIVPMHMRNYLHRLGQCFVPGGQRFQPFVNRHRVHLSQNPVIKRYQLQSIEVIRVQLLNHVTPGYLNSDVVVDHQLRQLWTVNQGYFDPEGPNIFDRVFRIR